MQAQQLRRLISPRPSAVFVRRFALLLGALLCASTASADASADALKPISDAAAALVNDDSEGFFDQFDRNMPGYAELRTEVEGLLGTSNVGATVDVITDDGDEKKRTLALDWVLVLSEKSTSTGAKETRRGVVKCRVERRAKGWKITALEPAAFFRP